MEEKWCRYNTLTDAITELAIPSERATQWGKAELHNHHAELSEEESTLFEWLLPQWHREFLQHKHYPAYAIKTSLARLANRDDDARDLWHDAALDLGNTPAALPIIKLSMLVYPLIDLAINRRQLCQAIIGEIKRGNLKPYVYPDSLEDRGLSDREKLQAYLRLPLTEQVFAIIELNELGRGLTTTETFQRQAHTLWKRYHDRARVIDEPAPVPDPQQEEMSLEEALAILNEGDDSEVKSGRKPDTQAQIDTWNSEVTRLWKTGGYRFHRDICKRIAADGGGSPDYKHIENETRATFHKLKPRKTK